MLKKNVLVIGLVLIISPGLLCSADFNLFEKGGKAGTFGGAFVARADDASAIYYNPAGISFLKGIQFKLNFFYSGSTLTAERENFLSPVKSKTGQFLASGYFSLNILDKISLGLGVFSPYFFESGLGRDWEESSTCSYSRLYSYFLRPVLAFKVSDKLAFGVGLDIIFSNLDWHHTFLLIYQDYQGNPQEDKILNIHEVSGNGIGFSAGFLFKISNKLQVGGRYQHKARADYEGFYRYTLMYLPTREATSSLAFPPEIVLGFMLSPSQKLSFQLDLQWTGWSVMQSLDFVPLEAEDDFDDKLNSFYFTQSIPLEGKDAWSLKTGIEYYLSSFISLKAGFSQHQSWQDTLNPVFPSLGRSVISVGFGYDGPIRAPLDERLIGFLSFDLYFQYVLSNKRSSPFSSGPVFYDADNWIVGVGIGWASEESK